jgi:hypothetical protein
LQFVTNDLWTYFGNLHQNKIPSLETLYEMAVALWSKYSNPGAFTSFMTGCHLDHSIVPIGEPWRDEEDINCEPGQPADSGDEGKGGEGQEEDKESKETREGGMTSITDKKFQGDHTLARSASFMYETLVSKEVAQAVAEGDVGRAYEGVKVSFSPDHNARFQPICHR